jgi:hypothetical protein
MRGTQVAEMHAWMRLGFRHAVSSIFNVPYDPYSEGPTWLLGRPEPWCINDDILYSVTHEVFYASDFGRSGISLPENVIKYLRLWVPVWAREYVTRGNWDMAAELIMVADCIPDFLWDDGDPLLVLLMNQTESGQVAGPAGSGSLLQDGSETAEQKLFFSVYHTTLVAAMALGLRQHVDRRSYALQATTGVSIETAESVNFVHEIIPPTNQDL